MNLYFMVIRISLSSSATVSVSDFHMREWRIAFASLFVWEILCFPFCFVVVFPFLFGFWFSGFSAERQQCLFLALVESKESSEEKNVGKVLIKYPAGMKYAGIVANERAMSWVLASAIWPGFHSWEQRLAWLCFSQVKPTCSTKNLGTARWFTVNEANTWSECHFQEASCCEATRRWQSTQNRIGRAKFEFNDCFYCNHCCRMYLSLPSNMPYEFHYLRCDSPLDEHHGKHFKRFSRAPSEFAIVFPIECVPQQWLLWFDFSIADRKLLQSGKLKENIHYYFIVYLSYVHWWLSGWLW